MPTVRASRGLPASQVERRDGSMHGARANVAPSPAAVQRTRCKSVRVGRRRRCAMPAQASPMAKASRQRGNRRGVDRHRRAPARRVEAARARRRAVVRSAAARARGIRFRQHHGVRARDVPGAGSASGHGRLDAVTTASRVCVVASGEPFGKWYHCACGDTSPHARHCVRSHAWWHPGQVPRVQNVFHTVPQLGMHVQRSSARGRHSQRGQKISGSLMILQ